MEKFVLSGEASPTFHRPPWVEAIGQIEELLSEVRVIEFKGNHIRLLLKTPIPSMDSLPLQYNSASFIEPTVVDHELMIEVLENNLEPMNLEIFPADVYVDEIIRNAKSSRHISTMKIGSFLGWLVRQVQKRILLCTIRRYFVRDANKSRYSFEYSDRDETITAHMVGGINAFLKTSQGWPLSSAPLTLISMNNSDTHSGSISLSFLCKVKDLANSLDMQIRRHLTSFIDAIEEILVQEMRSELH